MHSLITVTLIFSLSGIMPFFTVAQIVQHTVYDTQCCIWFPFMTIIPLPSHFSLLLGCALPIWMSSGYNDRPLAPFAGILSLGIGDTMVSFFSFSFSFLFFSFFFFREGGYSYLLNSGAVASNQHELLNLNMVER